MWAVPTNEQRRKAAKRKLERQIERRAERAKRRRQRLTLISVVGVVAIVAAAVGVYLIVNAPDAPEPVAAAPACTYSPGDAASKPNTPPDPNPPTTGTVDLTLQTTQGAIPLTLDRTSAPCAVNAVVSLATQGFYDDTPCPRLGTGQGL